MTEAAGDNCVLLVRRNVKPGQPQAIWSQLFAETRKLLREGVAPEILAEALRDWDNKPGSGPGTLPWLVSDVVRRVAATKAADKRVEKMRDWESQLEEELAAE